MGADSLSERTVTPLTGKRSIRVCACMGVPRLGWNDFWGCAQHALSHYGVAIRKYTGCFWSQQMQLALETCVRDGFDYILCLDYDTMFSTDHLKRLLQYTQLYPGCHAIAALQMKRGAEQALMSIGDKQEGELTKGLVYADTAHFGFTVLSANALKKMPKPWLLEQADPEGSWGPESTYPDLYFWRKWKAVGNTLGIATDIRVGHLELVVSEFSEDFQPRHIPVPQWNEENRPASINACTD